MKYDSIFSFGCSLMYGVDHVSTKNNTRPSEDVYTNLVAKHYNLKHYNFAINGSSNQSIAKQVYIATKFEQENNLKAIYWIGWTKYKHLGLVHPITKNIVGGWPYVDVQSELIRNSNSDITEKWAKDVYRSIDNFSRFVLSVNTVLQVNSFLSNLGKKCINSFNSTTWKTDCKKSNYYIKDKNKKTESLVENWIEKHTKKIDKNYQYILRDVVAGISGNSYKNFDPYLENLWLDIKKFIWFEWGENELGFQLWTRQNKFPLYKDNVYNNPGTWHPGEKSHREASKKIINSMIINRIIDNEMV